MLVTDATPLAQAEAHGAMLTHPRGHYEVWEGRRRLGAAGLRRRGLPKAIAWSEYDEHPRGRLVYDPGVDLFTLYADRWLQAPAIVAGIVAAFGLAGGASSYAATATTASADFHPLALAVLARPRDDPAEFSFVTP